MLPVVVALVGSICSLSWPRRNVLMRPVIGKHQYICMITAAAAARASCQLALTRRWTGPRGRGRGEAGVDWGSLAATYAGVFKIPYLRQANYNSIKSDF